MPSKGTQLWSEGAKLKMRTLTQDKDSVGLVCGVEENGVVSLRLVDTSSDKDVCIDKTKMDLGIADVILSYRNL